MEFPANLKYSSEHEWIRVEGEVAYVGITHHAQSQLGDIVYVDVTSLDENVAQNEVFGTVEAVKTVSDLYLPVSGMILEKNDELDTSPELVNTDPYGAGWMIKMTIEDPAELDGLMTAEEYAQMVAAE